MPSVDGFLGTWVLTPQSCNYALGEPPREGRYTIERDGPTGLRITMTWVDSSGMSLTDTITQTPDGRTYPFRAPGMDGISLSLHSDQILETGVYRGDQRLVSVRRVLSVDGRTMTVIMSGQSTDAKPWENRAIYRRSAD